MTTLCWTIIHHAAAHVARSAARIDHAAYHAIGPAHRAARLPHHAATFVGQPHTWVELVCKVVPAAVAGSGVASLAMASRSRPVSRDVFFSAATMEFRLGWLVPPLMEATAPSAISTPASLAFSTEAALIPLVSCVWKCGSHSKSVVVFHLPLD